MESHSRFDLTSARAHWTTHLAARGNLEPGKIAELESHLSDSIADLHQRGLNDAEAFLIATRRLGSPAEIEAEFEKAESTLLPRRALWWLILGVAGWTTLRSALGVLDSLLALAGASLTTSPAAFAAIVSATKLLSLGLFIWTLLAVARPDSRVSAMLNWTAQNPWWTGGFLLLANGLSLVGTTLSPMIILRQTSPQLAGEFFRVQSASSLISSAATLGLIVFLLVKARPVQHPAV